MKDFIFKDSKQEDLMRGLQLKLKTGFVSAQIFLYPIVCNKYFITILANYQHRRIVSKCMSEELRFTYEAYQDQQ